MPVLGKIFIFENVPEHNSVKAFYNELEAWGFLVFCTDNLYCFLQYAGEIKPDIVILHIPNDFHPDKQTWKIVEESLCRNKYLQIYANIPYRFTNYPNFHYVKFGTGTLKKEQILSIIKKNQIKYLH